MGLINRALTLFRRTPTSDDDPGVAVLSRLVATWAAGRALWLPDDYKKFAEEGYRRNLIIAACIWEIATSATEAPCVASLPKGEDQYEPLPSDHPLQVLLRKPNPLQSFEELCEQLHVHQQTTGNWYLHKMRSQLGTVMQLWALRPDRVRIVPDGTGRLLRYDYTLEEGTAPIPIAPNDVIHAQLHPDPLSDWYGLSPIAVASTFADLDNSAADFMRTFFTNAGVPAGLLKFKRTVDKKDRDRVKALWAQEHQGEAGWHSVSVLDGDASYQELGAQPDKLRLSAVWDETETRLCMAFGVPPALIQARVAADFQTHANYAEARASLWDETLTPLYKKTGSKIEHGLAYEFDASGYRYGAQPSDVIPEAKRIHICFDLSKVQALQEKTSDKVDRAVKLYAAGLVTLDEAREMSGLDPIGGEEGGQRKQPAPNPFASADGSAPPFGQPAADENQHRHAHARHATRAGIKARGVIKRTMAEHFRGEGRALADHLERQLRNLQ